MAVKRTYEIMYIAQPETAEEDITKLNEGIQKVIEDEGGSVVRIDNIGRKKLAYEINRKKEGYYVLLETEGSGKEIAEIERRFRVNDAVIRYITVRVDEDRKTADKHRTKRENRANKRAAAAGAQGENDDTDNGAEDNQ